MFLETVIRPLFCYFRQLGRDGQAAVAHGIHDGDNHRTKYHGIETKAGNKMQRDWDLIRAILTEAEKKQPGQMMMDSEVQGFDIALVREHIWMLDKAGYLRGKFQRGAAMCLSAIVLEITFKGYDLLDTIRAVPIWEKIKQLAKEKGLELTFDVVKELGGIVVKQIAGT